MGPLPASVYWRRRWLAVASTTAAVLLVIWLSAALGGDPGITTARTADTAVLNAPQPAPPSPAPVPTGSTAPTDPAAMHSPASPSSPSVQIPSPSDQPPSALSKPGTEGPPPPAATPATTSEELRPDETPRKSVPVANPVPVPSTGPVPCTDAMLTVGSEIDRPQHKVGEKPVLRLVITNTSAQPCVRDLDSARQEIVVWNSNQSAKVWSSNDCTNAHSSDLRTLVPGQPVAFAVTWAGRTSTPGCAQPRTVVPAGNYRVLTRLDDIISPPTLFTLTP